MSKRLSKLPSPAMTVAFVALLAALTGTAVALPGSNTVTQGDLVNNSVGKGETKTNAIGKAEIRTRAVGGSEANEATFGTVPSANLANSANVARFAGAANLAGTSVNVAGLQKSGLVGVNDGGTAPMFTIGGFRFSLACDVGNDPGGTGSDAAIIIENVSGGDGSHYDSQDGSDSTDFDEGDSGEYVLDAADEETEGDGSFGVTSANGVAIDGTGHISVDVGGDLPTDCAASALASAG